jgi:hypothetical protein
MINFQKTNKFYFPKNVGFQKITANFKKQVTADFSKTSDF